MGFLYGNETKHELAESIVKMTMKIVKKKKKKCKAAYGSSVVLTTKKGGRFSFDHSEISPHYLDNI